MVFLFMLLALLNISYSKPLKEENHLKKQKVHLLKQKCSYLLSKLNSLNNTDSTFVNVIRDANFLLGKCDSYSYVRSSSLLIKAMEINKPVVLPNKKNISFYIIKKRKNVIFLINKLTKHKENPYINDYLGVCLNFYYLSNSSKDENIKTVLLNLDKAYYSCMAGIALLK